MANMTATTMATYLPEQWSSLATITYRSNVVSEPLLDHRWEPEIGVGRGDTVNVPNFTQNTSASKRSTFGTGASLTFDAVQESQTQILVDQMAYKAFRIPAEMGIQAMSIYVPLLTSGIGEAVALKVDSEIAADGTNGYDAFTAIGSDNVDVTDDLLLQAEQVLNDANAPVSGRSLVVSPGTWTSIRKIERYSNSLYAGSVGNVKGDKGPGYVGNLYTFDIYQSNNLEAGTSGTKNAMFQKEAIAFAGQKALTMVKDLNVEDGLFDQYVGYRVYGFKLIKPGFGSEVDGK
jgi:hypothetical protein